MKPSITPTFVKHSGLLFFAYLIGYILIYWWSIIPEFIFDNRLSINGLLMVLSMIAVAIMSIKELIKNFSNLSILKLVAISLGIGFAGEMTFQIVRYLTNNLDILSCLKSAIAIALTYSIIAFLTAFQLKTKKTGVLWIMIVSLCVIANIVISF